MLENPIHKVMGTGGVDSTNKKYKQNAMQLMHGIWNLQNYMQPTKWKWKWVIAAQSLGADKTKPEIVPKPIEAPWWSIGLDCLLRKMALEHHQKYARVSSTALTHSRLTTKLTG